MLKVTGLGRLVDNAELRYLQDGTAVLNWRMAFNGMKKDAPATFANLSLFGKRGEALAQHLVKGSQLAVSGTLNNREYEKDGAKRTALEIRVDDIAFAGSKTDAIATGPTTQDRAYGKPASGKRGPSPEDDGRPSKEDDFEF